MKRREFQILGVGGALMDILAHVSEDFIRSLSGGKGGAVHIDATEQRRILDRCENLEMVPGGSAANTVYALSQLGLKTAIFSKLGRDAEGVKYKGMYEAVSGYSGYLFESGSTPTGKCLSLVTPDGERTMRVFLGASLELTSEELGEVDFGNFEVAYFEGYNLLNATFDETLGKAVAAKCIVALDLACYEIADRFKGKVLPLLGKKIDMVFANSDEAKALFGGGTDLENIGKLMKLCPVAIVKRGAQGAYIGADNQIFQIGCAKAGKVLDTTGAGDLWAAGFFYGYFNSLGWQQCGELGSRFAAEIIQVLGPKLSSERIAELGKGRTF